MILLLLLLTPFIIRSYRHSNVNPAHAVGDPLDTLNGVIVYYNGGVSHDCGRNVAADGYNLGMKYQCVEFVKRYYYEYLQHEMPDLTEMRSTFLIPRWKTAAKIRSATCSSSGTAERRSRK